MHYDEFPMWVKMLPVAAFVLGTRWGWIIVDRWLERLDARREERALKARDITPR